MKKFSEAIRRKLQGSLKSGSEIRLSPEEMAELGHIPKSAAKAIREFCISCMGGSRAEVARCTSVACPLWPFRFGKSPFGSRSGVMGRLLEPSGVSEAESAARAPIETSEENFDG